MKTIMLLAASLGFAVVVDGQETARFTIDTPAETRSGCSLVSLTQAGGGTVEQAGGWAGGARFFGLRPGGTEAAARFKRKLRHPSHGGLLPRHTTAPAQRAASDV